MSALSRRAFLHCSPGSVDEPVIKLYTTTITQEPTTYLRVTSKRFFPREIKWSLLNQTIDIGKSFNCSISTVWRGCMLSDRKTSVATRCRIFPEVDRSRVPALGAPVNFARRRRPITARLLSPFFSFPPKKSINHAPRFLITSRKYIRQIYEMYKLLHSRLVCRSDALLKRLPASDSSFTLPVSSSLSVCLFGHRQWKLCLPGNHSGAPPQTARNAYLRSQDAAHVRTASYINSTFRQGDATNVLSMAMISAADPACCLTDSKS